MHFNKEINDVLFCLKVIKNVCGAHCDLLMCLTGVLSRGDAVVRSVGNARHGCARLNGDEEGWSSTQRNYLWILQQGMFYHAIERAVHYFRHKNVFSVLKYYSPNVIWKKTLYKIEWEWIVLQYIWTFFSHPAFAFLCILNKSNRLFVFFKHLFCSFMVLLNSSNKSNKLTSWSKNKDEYVISPSINIYWNISIISRGFWSLSLQ